MKKLRLAVIGKDVSKSVSPQIHEFIAERKGIEITYEKISIPEENFPKEAEGLFSRFDGFNVTIPYKLSIIPYLVKVKGDAAVFGAVNTVLSAVREGYNTDGMGFQMMLANNGVEVSGKSALLLGAGGAGRSVAKKLADGGARVSVYDKNAQNAQRLAEEFGSIQPLTSLADGKFNIIVNATGVGMHNTEGISPVGKDILKDCDAAVDLIYEPKKSEFLSIAEGLNKQIINGRGMLFYQAYYSDCIYFGSQPSAEEAKELFSAFRKKFGG